MSAIKDGGPVFPLPKDIQASLRSGCFGVLYDHRGMSLRDWFAGQALAGLVFHNDYGAVSDKDIAKGAYKFADAMLKAREEDAQ
jgi:hypothetical protein